MPPFDPRSLPIYQHREEICAAVRQHQVVVIEGPTGCGKTTQLPRILLREGLIDGLIGLTQPRRIAAVSVAWRLAEEIGSKVGEEVGYAIRFDDQTSAATRVKVMTDGILLQESRLDPDFMRYDMVIVDEAHERSLNIDLSLGLLKRALKKRPTFRVIISSATLNPEIFQDYFADVDGPVPRVSIAARVHPVEIRYEATRHTDRSELAEVVAEAVLRLDASEETGHVLVFLPGQAAIMDSEKLLQRRLAGRPVAILPLYGQLTRDEQERVFADFDGRRKIVLATNIAETSITIPEVRFVVDTGIAKVPRFDGRTGITTLREEPISQASLAQRAGRAGRTGPGVVVRLFPERSLQQRPAFTDEEICRLDLSEVALRLIDLGVHDVEAFPFPTPPPLKALRRAIWTLRELGAINEDNHLTPVGQKMVPFPLSPRLARMIVEAGERYPSTLDDVLVLASYLSVRTPYLFPQGEEGAARQAHDMLADALGDAVTAVRVYRNYRAAPAPAAYCKKNYLDPDTMAFIVKAHQQLGEIATRIGYHPQSDHAAEPLIRCVMVAFSQNYLLRQGRTYATAGGSTVAIHPSSALFGTHQRLLIATELVNSSRVYAHQVSVVRPQWLMESQPELARAWRLHETKALRNSAERPPSTQSPRPHSGEPSSAPPPTSLHVGGINLTVIAQRRRVQVIIPRDAVEILQDVSREDIPREALQWRSTIRDGAHGYLSGLPFAKVLALLPFVPLPKGEPAPAASVPQGALLSVERNIATIERHLPGLLAPTMPFRGKRPGWLMLVANGDDGFWFAVDTDFVAALTSTVEALEALVDTYADDDPHRELASERLGHFQRLAEDVSTALTRAGASS